MRSLAGITVADLTRQLPGPFASRELLRLGARVVKIEPPEGDPMPDGWYRALNEGKEIVSWDARAEPAPQVLADADVVLEGFRPGVFERLGDRAGADDDPLLDHRLRHPRTACARCRPRPQLPRLRGRARRHRAGHAAGAGRRSRGRRTRRRDRDPRSAARTRAIGARRTHRRLDDALDAPLRRSPPCRRPGAAPAHRRRRVLPDLRDRRRPASDRRRARAEVLAQPLRRCSSGPTSSNARSSRNCPSSTSSSARARCMIGATLLEGKDTCVGPVLTLVEAADELT